MNSISRDITDGFRLEPISFIYAHDITEAMQDRTISDHALSIPYPYFLKDALGFILMVKRFEMAKNVQKEWVIVHDSKMVGGIGLLWNHGVKSHKSEIGYWIKKEFRNKGLMTKTLVAFSNMIFENFNIVRLEAHVYDFNIASAKALENAGFSREGLSKNAFCKKGNFLNAYLFSKCK